MSLTVEYYKQKTRAFLASDRFSELQREWTRDLALYAGSGCGMRYLYSLGTRTLSEPAVGNFFTEHWLFCAAGVITLAGLAAAGIRRCMRWRKREPKQGVETTFILMSLALYDALMFGAGWWLMARILQ